MEQPDAPDFIFCSRCGKESPVQSRFCSKCGTQMTQTPSSHGIRSEIKRSNWGRSKLAVAGILGGIAVFILAVVIRSGVFEPSPPVLVKFRPSLIDSRTLVLQLYNEGDKRLVCTVSAANMNTNEKMHHSLILEPFSQKEIGVLETGWSFITGELVIIGVKGYRKDYQFLVP